MKKAQLKSLITEIVRLVLMETIQPKFWWLDPEGKFHKVPAYGHWDWAFTYLTKVIGIPEEKAKKDAYGIMAKYHRFYRVVLTEYGGKTILEYESPKDYPPSPRQLKAIKDMAIELSADEINAIRF